jgi:hypothetical protein
VDSPQSQQMSGLSLVAERLTSLPAVQLAELTTALKALLEQSTI